MIHRSAILMLVAAAGCSSAYYEIKAMKDAGLRGRSQQLRRDSLGRYDRMLAAMKKAEASMTPVLDTMHPS